MVRMICIWWLRRLGRCVVRPVDRVCGLPAGRRRLGGLGSRSSGNANVERRTSNVEPKRGMLRTEQRSVHWHTGGPPVPLLWTGLGKSRSMPPPLFCSKFGVECSKFGFSSGGRLPASASPCWDPGIERGKALTRVPGRI